MSTKDRIWLVGFVIFVALIAAMQYDNRARAQERDASYPQTRMWEIGSVRREVVTVIDTAGVCLYMVANNGNHETSLVAVPKTQLPKGAGCQ